MGIDATPRVMFHLIGLPIRDTVVATWIVMIVLVVGLVALERLRPTALEMVVDFVLGIISGFLRRPQSYLPFIGSVAVFVLAANLIGFVPVIVTPTRDLNTAVAMAVVVFFAVHFFGMREMGVRRYLKGLATPGFLLPLELIGQVSRTVSLAIRLFGNIVSFELIIAVVMVLIPVIVPSALLAFNLLTSSLQAYIFTTLTVAYIASGIKKTD